MKHIVTKAIPLTLIAVFVLAFVQYQTLSEPEKNIVTYSESDENFPNPERGFTNWSQGTPGRAPMRAEQLAEMRNDGQTLLTRLYHIGDFRESDLSQEFLDQLDGDFQAMREAGIKSIIRFRYTTSMDGEDAPLERIESHLDQLQPVFERNYDVIATTQAGFIGAWGEWHASSNNLANTTNRRAVLRKFLEVLPEERTVQLRNPDYKWDIYDHDEPLTPEQAFDGSNLARTAHHNDCFLASPTDVGTYHGLDAEAVKEYLSKENRYLPMGGETCDPRDDAGDRYHCETALHELEWLRWSYMNSSYSEITLDQWRDEGCMPEIKRRLGYRFVMTEGRFTEEVSQNGTFQFELDIDNVGFATLFNPRDVKVVLRNAFNPDELWIADLPDDPRLWERGETTNLVHDIGISEDMTDGMYEAFLYLPDPADQLSHRPRFAIRTANQGTWNSDTGFNSLNHVLVIDESAESEPYDGDLYFEQQEIDFATSATEPASADVADRVTLDQNFPNPFNPATQIAFHLPDRSHVSLNVYDVMGRHVATLAEGEYHSGRHEVTFDATRFSSGTYIYRLQAGSKTLTRQMLLLK